MVEGVVRCLTLPLEKVVGALDVKYWGFVVVVILQTVVRVVVVSKNCVLDAILVASLVFVRGFRLCRSLLLH